MAFQNIGPMQTQFGLNLADLQTRAAMQDRQMRQASLEAYKQRLFEMFQQEELIKQQKKTQKRGLITAGVGAGVGAGLGLLAAPALASLGVGGQLIGSSMTPGAAGLFAPTLTSYLAGAGLGAYGGSQFGSQFGR